ncbi:acyltransferase [Stenotrophomonas sp. C3(2023)]|uniref:acyltransferase family protein n=1 Tax=Stenotrophomonas sp. C3(2023) TaxID=3080277 RepID=UPI00293C4EB5|nr:acyltransferase [Stenotrophomonas sp. C3(2023)]MDV3467421.1 acyltransferase [Stenotrophomonas sp. C3(2023)]
MHQNRFASLQALRGLAALAVVLFHLRGTELKYLPGPALLEAVARYADAGVDLFFVLSGFVMTTITAGRYGGLRAAGSFLVRRGWRVLPPYWLFTTLVVVLMLLAPGMVNSSYQGQSILSSYLLLPHAQLPVLTVGWTLVHEAWFYLMFAAAIAFILERAVPGYLLLWAGAVGVLRAVMPADASPAYQLVSNPLTLEFIAGGLLGLYWRRLPVALGLPLLGGGLVLAVAAAALLPAAGPASMSVWTRVLLFGTASALLVAGAVLVEARQRRAVPRWLAALGDSSYALYLSHIFVLSAVGRVWMMLWPSDAALNHAAFVIANVLACCVVGWLVHRWVEQPLLLLPQRRRRSAVHAGR